MSTKKKEQAIKSIIELFIKIFELDSVPRILEDIPKVDPDLDPIVYQYAFMGAVYMSMIRELVTPISALDDALKECELTPVQIDDVKHIIIEVIKQFDIESLWNTHTNTETPTHLS